jgi:hypothetical protein
LLSWLMVWPAASCKVSNWVVSFRIGGDISSRTRTNLVSVIPKGVLESTSDPPVERLPSQRSTNDQHGPFAILFANLTNGPVQDNAVHACRHATMLIVYTHHLWRPPCILRESDAPTIHNLCMPPCTICERCEPIIHNLCMPPCMLERFYAITTKNRDTIEGCAKWCQLSSCSC